MRTHKTVFALASSSGLVLSGQSKAVERVTQLYFDVVWHNLLHEKPPEGGLFFQLFRGLEGIETAISIPSNPAKN